MRLKNVFTLQESRAGVAYTIVEVNTPPRGGGCSVTPATGTPFDTTFTFSCANWTDDRIIEEVQFFGEQLETEMSERAVQLTHTLTS